MTKKHKTIIAVAIALAVIAGLWAFFTITPATLGEMAAAAEEETTQIAIAGDDGEENIYQTEDSAQIKEFIAYLNTLPIDLSGFSEPDDEDYNGGRQYTIRFYDGIMITSYFILDDSGNIFYGGRVYRAAAETMKEIERLASGWQS